MKRILLQAGLIFVVAPVSANASVIEFFDDGSVIRHDAVDYRRRAVFNVYKPRSTYTSVKDYDDFIYEASQKYGVDHKLIKAVIYVESRFNADAVSPKGAMGLMQLMPDTAGELGVSDPFDPASNIEGGVRYLSQLITENRGDTSLALAAYNAGQGAVNKYGGVPPYEETENYVDAVLMLVSQEGN